MNINLMSCSQIISFNPILQEKAAVKNAYGRLLLRFADSLNNSDNKWLIAEKNLYSDLLIDSDFDNTGVRFLEKYGLFFIADLANIFGYDSIMFQSEKFSKELIKINRHLSCEQRTFFTVFNDILTEKPTGKWFWLKTLKIYGLIEDYFSVVEGNMKFMQQPPFKIIITATMSAGKSTFINALVGQKISTAENLVSTSKIHTIISKAYNDGFIYKEDGILSLNVSEQSLLKYNSSNEKSSLITSAYFNGNLSGMRVILNDSPGVNASDHSDHRKITERTLQSQKFDLIVYVMNATQFFTNDDDLHLNFVKENLEHQKILFLVNKIDQLNPEEENVFEILERVRKYTLDKGFKQPMICPVSALAGFMAKQNLSRKQKLGRSELLQFNTLFDKLEDINLSSYYEKQFPFFKIENQLDENEQLLKISGFAYVELIIKNLALLS